jgi:two-component system response regulator YesN
MSPKHYSDCLKMQIASERLLSTDFTLNLIADQLGYVDRFHFSKVFKRIKGLSPDLFRRQYLMV